jgi:hypothetical protein
MKPKYLFIGAALIGVLIVAAALFVRVGRPDARIPDARIVAVLTDVGATDVQRWWVPPDITERHAYTDRYTFTIGQAKGGGDLFRCTTKQDCDTLVAYIETGRRPLGYYVYQSANGTTVVKVGDYLEARAAARFADAIRDLP